MTTDTSFVRRNGGAIKWFATLFIGGAVYYSGVEVTKAQVEFQGTKLNTQVEHLAELERKREADHDILVELRADMKLLKQHVLRKNTQ